jgi:plastocyanin
LPLTAEEIVMSKCRIAAATALSLLLAAPAAAQPAVVAIQLSNFHFAPQPIRLAAGRPVTLRFVNESGSGHNFTAPGFFQHARILAGGTPGGAIDLAPHQSRTISLVPAAGTYQAHCSHFLHSQMGMTDTIIVN